MKSRMVQILSDSTGGDPDQNNDITGSQSSGMVLTMSWSIQRSAPVTTLRGGPLCKGGKADERAWRVKMTRIREGRTIK